ncbi:MAG TPA: M3 family peptidase [Bacteroidetes bacterium]|nr:M3 family peptidase [Bacteroidota bacterium]
MTKLILTITLISFLFISCNRNNNEKQMNDNPLLTEWNTPYGVPPFNLIKTEHYLPAYNEAMKMHNAEIEAIVNSKEEPDFNNTIAALDYSGELLIRVDNVFENVNEANTNPEMQKIAKEVAPLLSAHYDNIWLNDKLFARVKAVNDIKEALNLTTEQQMLLKKVYDNFVRGGANLPEDQKAEFRKINEQLSLLSINFGENLLAETNDFTLVIEDEKDLSGLPESVKAAAAETAKEQGLEGKWVFTLQKPSLIPFITYAENRENREYLFKGYIERGNNNNEHDNKAIVSEIVNLRLRRANMLGYDTHADYVLDNNMAKTPDKVYGLIESLMDAGLVVAKQEVKDLQALIDKEGENFKLEPWDWWYYAEKLKKEKYAFDDETLRPYFVLENVQKGLFTVANKLYGLQLTERTDLPVYHPDVKVYEVKEADGSVIGILYMDFFPRESKRGGAWMSSFRKQYKKDGGNVVPVIQTVFNFTKPTGDKPSLLSFDEASTMFHEFGHALHGLLSNCTYISLSGTAVPRDFVELPSQIMENWAAEPEVLKMYALNYKTGEPIPDELIEKMKNAGHFNQGFITVEFMSAALLDMDWHTITEQKNYDVTEFENASLEKMHMIPEIVVRYRSTYFAHIFSGGYSSGYYSYAWAEVLDADAFEAFKENGIFDQATARAFRENILSMGGTDDPMKLYVQFRGREPKTEAMLKRKGLLKN